jgi:ferrous-iron efflux pump FieF
VCGILVGGYVLYSAFLILKSAIVDLMDGSLPPNVQTCILKTIKEVDGVKEIKILKTRSAGMKKYIESIIKVSSKTSFVEANNITKKAESRLSDMFEKVDVIIKAEPD